MTNRDMPAVMRILKKEVRRWREPVIDELSRKKRNPYQVLIGCLLSLRTKDETTHEAAERLFAIAEGPEEMVRLSTRTIERAIYPVGFYRNKAKQILHISRTLLKEYDGEVPASLEELLKLKGVGRKTANLVLTRGYNLYGICVDTHVHRITNRWGYVETRSPDETEMALREKLPKRYWKSINGFLVTYGQNLCKPISPFCSRCPLAEKCKRVGVTQSR